MSNLYNVLLGMIETEKAVRGLQPINQYSFIVSNNSTKIDVRNAVQKMYGVHVVSVNKLPVRKKIRKLGKSKITTKRPEYIKAVVTIKSGEKIDLTATQEQK